MNSDSPWTNLANFYIGKTKNLLYLGPQWSYKQAVKMKTHFGRMLFWHGQV